MKIFEDQWRLLMNLVWWFDIEYAFCALQFLGVLSCHLSLFLTRIVLRLAYLQHPYTDTLHARWQPSLLNHLLSPATRATWVCLTWDSASGVWCLKYVNFRFGWTKRQPSEPVRYCSIPHGCRSLHSSQHHLLQQHQPCLSYDSAALRAFSVHSPCTPRHV